VFLAGGYEEAKDGEQVRRTRIPVIEFVAGMRLSLRGIGKLREGAVAEDEEMAMDSRVEEVGRDEVECLIANMIYKVSFGPLVCLCALLFFFVFFCAIRRS